MAIREKINSFTLPAPPAPHAPRAPCLTFQEQFLNYKGINFGKQDKVHNNYVVPLQFHFNTTYNNDFINHNQAEKMQPCLPTNLNPFPRIDLFLGESTNQRDFSPKERDPTKKQIATDVIPPFLLLRSLTYAPPTTLSRALGPSPPPCLTADLRIHSGMGWCASHSPALAAASRNLLLLTCSPRAQNYVIGIPSIKE